MTESAAETPATPPPPDPSGPPPVSQSSQHSALAIAPHQTEFTGMQKAALYSLGVDRRATPDDLRVYFHQIRRTGLDPFLKQIYLIMRMTYNPETKQKEPKFTIQTGIDGFRLVARRAADLAHETLEHEDPLWCGPDGEWRDVWLDPVTPPVACKYVVLRNGKRFPAVALFHEYCPTKDVYSPDVKDPETGAVTKGRPTGEKAPSGQWGDRPAHMIAKCAEALAERKAFPQDLSGIFLVEELERDHAAPAEVLTQVGRQEAPPPTGNDWLTMIADAPTGDALNEIFFRVKDAGEFTEEIGVALHARGKWFREHPVIEHDDQPAEQSEEDLHDEDPHHDPASDGGQ